jgi:hypothetical protein
MGVQLTMTGVIPSDAVLGYNPGASSSIPNVYSSPMPPPPPPSQPYSQLDTSSSSTRYTSPDETTSSSSMRHIHQSSLGSSTSTLSPIPSTALHSPSLARHRALAGDISSSSSTVRNSPLSLPPLPHFTIPILNIYTNNITNNIHNPEPNQKIATRRRLSWASVCVTDQTA